MASIFDKARDLLKNVKTGVQNNLQVKPGTVAYKALMPAANAQQFIQSNQSFQLPQVPQAVNRVTQINTPVGAIQPVQIGRDIANTVVSQGIVNPAIDIGRMLAMVPTGRDTINYQTAKSPATKLGFQMGSLFNPQAGKSFQVNNSPQQVIGNIAETAIPPITAYGGNFGLNLTSNAVLGAAKQGFLNTVKKGAVQGGVGAGIYGLLTGLSEGKNGTLPQQLLEGLKQGAIGTGVGIISGGTLAGGGFTFGAIRNRLTGLLQQKYGFNASQARDALGRFAKIEAKRIAKGGKPAANEPVWIGDLREQVGLSRNGDLNEGGFIRLGKEKLKEESAQELASQAIDPLTTNTQQLSPQIGMGGQKTGALSQIIPESNPPSVGQTISLGNGTSGGGVGMPVENSSKYAFNINKNRLQLSPEQKATLEATVNAIKPELEQIKGKAVSNNEVMKAAKTSEILQKVTSREETLAAEAATLRARQRLSELDQNITQLQKSGNVGQMQVQMKDLIESLRVVSSNAADAGRKLQSLSINAGDESIRMQVLKDVAKTSNNTDEILKAAEGVDWNNADSITKFYRQFIKPTIPELLDEFRYNNMLSSPKTHIRNAFSNVTQTFITRPATLAAEGRPVEAVKYLGGTVKNFPTAIKAFADAFKGKTLVDKPDLERIPTGLPKFLTVPTKLLEAGDQFFSALIKGGEAARGATPETAEKTAAYYLFRQGLKPEGQGKVLNAIDEVTNWTYKAPKAVRWFVPFIRTPMNFAKQWIEYSPAGISTVVGAGNKREQVAKTILGSMATAVGASLAMNDRTTWAAPTDAKEKELFYAAGKKPFSVLIGDKWVPMMYAGPFAFALALPAAAKFYQEDNKTALTDDGLTKLTKTATSMAQFLSGQTFLEGLGNFVKWASGDADYSLGSNLAFTGGQLVPFQGMLRYISTVMDPIYRKPKGFGESFMSGIPTFSKDMEAYTEPNGQPSTRANENYYMPFDLGKRNPQYEGQLENRINKLQTNSVFTEDLRQFDAVDEQIKTLVKAGNKEEAVQLLKDNKELLLKGKMTKEFKSKYEKLYKDLNAAQVSNKISPDQRAKLMNIIGAKIKELDVAYKKFKQSQK